MVMARSGLTGLRPYPGGASSGLLTGKRVTRHSRFCQQSRPFPQGTVIRKGAEASALYLRRHRHGGSRLSSTGHDVLPLHPLHKAGTAVGLRCCTSITYSFDYFTHSYQAHAAAIMPLGARPPQQGSASGKRRVDVGYVQYATYASVGFDKKVFRRLLLPQHFQEGFPLQISGYHVVVGDGAGEA